jgi:hypothetical protein
MVLAEVAAVAGILGNAANIIDKIYGRFFERKTGKPPPAGLEPEHSGLIRNDPAQGALVVTHRGTEWARVTYDELGQRLSSQDMRHIKTREKVMNQLYEQWEATYPTLATEMNPIRKKQLEQQLDEVTDSLGKELDKVLGFITKSGLMLDDHYQVFHDIAAK